MLELSETQVNELRWGDANYFGYYWDPQFKDPTLIIRIAPANSSVQELVCNWATNLKVNLDYKKHVNPLLTWEVTFEGLPNKRWKVVFDFTDHGSIEFESNELAVRQLPSPTTT